MSTTMHPKPTALILAFSGCVSAATVTVTSTLSQTFTGVGGSGAWWPMDLYRFPESSRQRVADLLFADSGLGLSSYRWNIGGGGVNVSNPTRAPETFYVGPNKFNWTADAQGVYFLKEAAKRGVEITAFVNSAPAVMTSGKASCNGKFVTGTGGVYASYLAGVLDHFIREEKIPIRYISPMNEPDSNFGPSPCGQEGMQVVPEDRAEVVSSLYQALAARGLDVKIIVDESSSLSRAQSEYSAWLPKVINQVGALVHHTYDFPSDSAYKAFVDDTRKRFPGKDIWMSEVCCSLGQADGTGRGWSQGYDPTIKNALMWVGMAFQSFIVANEPHYDWWVLLASGMGCSPYNNPTCVTTPNSNGWTDGLIYYDANYATNKNYELYITKHFWTYKHIANFVKPNSKRVILSPETDYRTLVVRADNRYHVLAMNPYSTQSNLTLTFASGQKLQAAAVYRTSEKEDWAVLRPEDLAKQGQSGWNLALGAMSLTTFVFNIV